MLSVACASAAEPLWDSLQIHGFASQAAVRTSDNRYFGDSPNTSFAFTEVGINASLPLNPRILLSGQLLARRAGAMYDGTPALDYALADVTLASSAAQRWGFRAGRIKNPLGIYNETRDVPFTHPGIFLPQVIYFDKVRNLVLSLDGLMFYGSLYGNTGTVSLTMGGGRSVIDDNVEWVYLGNDYPGELQSDGNTGLIRLWYSTPGEQLKFGLSGAALSLRFHPGRHSPLSAGTTDILYWIASIQYETENWTLSAEYAREPLEWRDYHYPLLPNLETTTEGYYLQGTYRIQPDVELLLRYEEGFGDRNDRDGVQFSALTGVPPFTRFSKIWTAGLRWDINRQWMVRAEYQRHHGTFILSSRENPDSGQLREDWSLFAVQAAFRF
ncbi:MAG: hypothetical protein H6975_11700 [Gammaproteobacteria bacterium]|nr:hypothetical protein [Gammaproteobacteria bacterium]